jgi:hypothetical protein
MEHTYTREKESLVEQSSGGVREKYRHHGKMIVIVLI